ncbi:NAD-dependent 15-hydroxyprostaglandin dehydrogenase [Aspergillus heteromorphus CBS 117.55]|uniref:NAD-dependent 15-hydroxyprostaglandin dehydrogenase n=1 Tax=Aspergillus heteromorphus CBS 117.55 TaxID=1448321 RepID=A0A317WU62_9EURO|nr:NAD-dependent 15-hydroxyprostaglandin dehydrogenase [Aspergillus heteromorphus CBS 117.55]PWY89896.1 NAD-dependent 15-hydroxyprostaglandin dehydrogenase [Aspergillus heteromorphus CBS 117.55]
MNQNTPAGSAIVTGAGSGINLAFATLLLQNGYNVLIADLKLSQSAETLVGRYGTRSSPRAVFVQTDVCDWAQLRSMFIVAEKEFGSVEIVCPGAGVFEPAHSSFWAPPGSKGCIDSPMKNGYVSLDINLIHPIYTTQLAIAYFMKHKNACPTHRKKHIIHVSSIAGEMALLALPLYAIAKRGVIALTQSLAPLEALGIRVTGIAPGIVKTPIWSQDKLALVDESIDKWVEVDRVADVMFDLVSKDQIQVSDTESIVVKGGTVLELSQSLREVLMYNDPGPLSRPGNTVAYLGVADEQILQLVGSEGWETWIDLLTGAR